MSIHDRLAPCLLHLNRWFPKDIVTKILRMAGPCAVQMALLAHNREKEELELAKGNKSMDLVKMFIGHGELGLFDWLCEVRELRLPTLRILCMAAETGNVEAIQAFCAPLPDGSLKKNAAWMACGAAKYGRVNVLEFLDCNGCSLEIQLQCGRILFYACKGRSVPVARWIAQHSDFSHSYIGFRKTICEAISSCMYELVEIVISVVPTRTEDRTRFLDCQAVARTGDGNFMDQIIHGFPEVTRSIVIEAAKHGYLRTLRWAISRGICKHSDWVAVEIIDIRSTALEYTRLDELVRLAKECNINVQFGPDLLEQLGEIERATKRLKEGN